MPLLIHPVIHPGKTLLGLFAVLICAGCSDVSSLPDASRFAEGDAANATAAAALAEIPEPYHIRITGRDKHWHVQYAGADGRDVFTGDGPALQDIHVPQDTEVVLVLNSTDYIYTLKLPQFGIKEVAVPSLEFSAALPSSCSGVIEFSGDELCGDPHPGLQGRLIVEPREQFIQWLHEASADAAE